MWKFELLDWAGVRLGEITNAQNVKLNFGLSKNSNLTLETPLRSQAGKTIGNNDYLLVSAYQRNPSTGAWDLRFIGPIINIEEIGENGSPTIAIACVGAYWRLSKRIVNNANNEGRKERGVPAAPASLTRVIVCDTNNNRLVYWNEATGAWIKNKGGTAAGTGNDQFNAPRGIAVNNSNGNYYVLDSGNARIQQYDANDTYVRRFGGGTLGTVPRGIAVDKDGNVWVGDRANDRLLKYSATGTLLLTITATTNYRLEQIFDVVSYGDRIIVCDVGLTYKHGQQAFDLNGTFLGKELYTTDRPFRSCAPSSIKTDTIDPVFGDVALNYYSSLAFLTFVSEFQPRQAPPWYPQIIDGAFASYPGHCETRTINPGYDIAYCAWSETTAVYDGVLCYSYDTPPIDNSTIPFRLSPIRSYGGVKGSGNGQMSGVEYFAIWQSQGTRGDEVVANAINETNSLDGNSWIQFDSTNSSATPEVVIDYNTWGGYKKISEAIDDLAGNLEWKINPVLENAGNMTTVKLGKIIVKPIIGSNKSSTVNFEYGTARLNVESYAIRQNLEGLVNRLAYPTAGYVPYSILTEDTTSIGQIGLFEDIITGSLYAPELRTETTQLGLELRKDPRLMVEITPVRSDATTGATVPKPLVDYEPGDIVGVIIYDSDEERINGELRIYDIEINVDNNGKEEAVLKLYVE